MRGDEDSVSEWMPLYVRDLLLDTDDLSIAEFGAYLRLLVAMWTRRGTLPHDPERLARIAGCDRTTFDTVWPVIRGYFSPSTDGTQLTQKRLAHELERARLTKLAAIERGSRGGRATADKRRQLALGLLAQAPDELSPQVETECSSEPLPKPLSESEPEPEPKPPLRGGRAQGRARSSDPYSGILALFSALWAETYGQEYLSTGADRSQLGRVLRDFPSKEAIEAYPWAVAFRNYLGDLDKFVAGKKRHSLAHFCTEGGVNKYRVADRALGLSEKQRDGAEATSAWLAKQPNGRRLLP